MADNKLELIIDVDAGRGNAAIKGVNKNLSELEKQAVSSSKRASSGIDGMTLSLTKGVLAGNALYDMAKKALGMLKQFTLGAIEAQAEMGKTAEKIGLNVKEFSAFSHVAKLTGLDAETLSRAVGLLSKNMLAAAQGSKEQRKHFASLGIEYQNANKTLRSNVSVLEDVADRFKGMQDGAAKTALALQLFGRSGKELIPMLNKGGEGIRAMMEEADAFGLVIDKDAANAARRFKMNLAELRGAVEGLSFKVAQELLPSLIRLTSQALQWAKDGGFQKLAGHIRDVAEWVKNLGMWIASYALVSGLLRAAAAVRELAVGIGTLNAAMVANPWGLAAIGIATFGYALWKEYDKIKQTRRELEGLNRQAEILAQFKAGRKLEELKKAGFTEEEIRFAIAPGFKPGEIEFPAAKFKVKGFEELTAQGFEIPDEEAEKIQKFINEATRAARDFRRSAEEALAGPAAKEIMEVQKEIEKLTTFMDERGLERQVQLSAAAREDIERALQLKIQALQKESVRQIVKDYEEAARRRWEADVEYYRQRLDYEERLADQQQENVRQLLSYEEERAATRREAALRRLEMIEPETLEDKIALEARKAEVEVQYLRQIHDVKTALFDSETRMLVYQFELQRDLLAAAGQNVDRINVMIAEIKGQREEIRGQLDEQTEAAVTAARENAAIRQGQIIRDEQRRIFDSLKRQAEGVFDALVTRSQSVFSAIANAFKTAMLTAIKEVVTSHVARLLMQLFGGLRIPVAGGAPAGSGTMGGIFGGVAPILVAGGAGGGGIAVPGAGTAPFVPAAGGGGTGIGGFLNFGGLKEFLGFGGGVQYAPGHAATWAASSFGQKLSALGRSNAALVGGATLALMGLQRGGISGLAMTTAGGALIGFKYGGPVGAAIGAGIGAAAGIVRLFKKSAEEKAREKIRATYGVEIKDKGVLRQIVEMARQGFGGNLDMAIRSQQVRDLVELYAMTTGQSTARFPAKLAPVSLVQAGGSLFQQSALPGTGLQGMGAAAAAPTVINITVPGAKEFFEKETVRVVIENPRAVQSAVVQAAKGNYNRRELAGLQLSPGTLTS